jgi:hypothetical protein
MGAAGEADPVAWPCLHDVSALGRAAVGRRPLVTAAAAADGVRVVLVTGWGVVTAGAVATATAVATTAWIIDLSHEEKKQRERG